MKPKKLKSVILVIEILLFFLIIISESYPKPTGKFRDGLVEFVMIYPLFCFFLNSGIWLVDLCMNKKARLFKNLPLLTIGFWIGLAIIGFVFINPIFQYLHKQKHLEYWGGRTLTVLEPAFEKNGGNPEFNHKYDGGITEVKWDKYPLPFEGKMTHSFYLQFDSIPEIDPSDTARCTQWVKKLVDPWLSDAVQNTLRTSTFWDKFKLQKGNYSMDIGYSGDLEIVFYEADYLVVFKFDTVPNPRRGALMINGGLLPRVQQKFQHIPMP